MSVTCYVVQSSDISEFGKRIFGDESVKVSSTYLRGLINQYAKYKGFTDYQKFKENLDDFYNYIEKGFLDNSNFSEESFSVLHNILEETPQLQEELDSKIADSGIEYLNYFYEESNFKKIPLENGKYKIYLPLIVKEKPKSYHQEIDEIKLKTTLDGTFMLAPNGNPTNLTERQWLHVRTKAFKEWFGDWEKDPANASKVVDENGEPLVVYHGNRTSDKINIFDKSKIGSEHIKILDGFWFITDENIAKHEYALKPESFGKGEKYLEYGEVLSVFLNIRNPIVETQKGLRVENSPFGKMTLADEKLMDFFNRIKDSKEDSDGYILTVRDSDNNADPFYESKQIQLVVKDSNQIKSATDNIGSYSRENDDIYYQKDVLSEVQKLKLLQGPLKNRGSLSKQKESLKRARIDSTITNAIIKAVELDPSLGALSAYEIFELIASSRYRDLELDYHKAIEEPIIEGLEEHLKQFLSKFHVDFVDGSKLCKEHGITGAFDILNKVIHLAKDRNALTVPEEAAHAIVELLGAVPHKNMDKYPETKDATFLLNNVENTSIYKRVFEEYKDTYVKEDGSPDIYKIKKEAIGQALAVAIRNNWENSVLETETTFWQKLKEFFDKILNYFKNSEYLSFDTLIDTIAKDVIKGDYKRFNKIDSKDWGILDYSETIANQNKLDGGKALGFMQYFSKLGNIITGSLAYRKQGEVYRGKLDALHDIDMKVPANAHNINLQPYWEKEIAKPFGTRDNELLNALLEEPYFKQIVKKYPKIKFIQTIVNKNNKNTITISAVYSENDSLTEKFSNLDGAYSARLDSFTEEERKQIYIFNFFLEDINYDNYLKDTSNDINLTRQEDSMKVKVFEYGRAKDIFDYQSWKLFDEYKNDIPSEKQFLMFQKSKKDSFNNKIISTTQENTFEFFDRAVEYLKNTVTKDKDFKNNHKYNINGKPVDVTVSQYVSGKTSSESSQTVYTATGNIVDNAVRKYFESISHTLIASKNLPKQHTQSISNICKNFEDQIKKVLGNTKYKIVTSEILLGGYLPDGKSIAGSPDIVIVTENKEIYIVDTKTYTNLESFNDSKIKYFKQVDIYGQLLLNSLHSLEGGEGFTYKGGFLLPIQTPLVKPSKNPTIKEDAKGNYTVNNQPISDYFTNGTFSSHPSEILIKVNNKDIKPVQNIITESAIKQKKLKKETVKTEYTEVPVQTESNKKTIKKKDLITIEEETLIKDSFPGVDIDSIFEEVLNSINEESEETTLQTSSEITPNYVSSQLFTLGMKPSQINYIGKTIVKLFSYYVDLMTQEESLKDFFGLSKDIKESLVGMESEQVIKQYFDIIKTPILNFIRDNILTQNVDSENIDDIFEMVLNSGTKYELKDYIEDLFQNSFSTFLETENVSIKVTEKEEDEDSSLENREEDGREPYFIDKSEKSYLDSIPTKIKRMLSIIPKCTLEDGQILKDDNIKGAVHNDTWIYNEEMDFPVQFYEQVEVVNYLFDNLYNYRSIQEMMDFLNNSDLFFCKYIYDKLKDDPTLQTLFFRTFRKNKTSYIRTKGYSNFEVQFLEDYNAVSKILKRVQSAVINNTGNSSYVVHRKQNSDVFEVNTAMLQSFLTDVSNSKGTNIKKLAANCDSVLRELQILLPGQIPLIPLQEYKKIAVSMRSLLDSLKDASNNDLDYITKAYRKFIYSIISYIPKQSEITHFDGSKTYMVFTEPSFIQDTVEDFKQNKWQIGKDNSKQYVMKIEKGKKVYLNSFYEDFKDYPNALEIMQHYRRTSVNGNMYMEISDYDYLKTLIADYFMGHKENMYIPGVEDTSKVALYRVLTMSDKPSSEAIRFFKTYSLRKNILEEEVSIELQNMKNAISDRAYRYFYYELQRMEHVYRRLVEGAINNTEYEDIATFHLDRKSEGAQILLSKACDITKDENWNVKYTLKANPESLTIQDFVKDGKLRKEFEQSGLSFRFLQELNSIFEETKDSDSVKMQKTLLDFLQYKNKGSNLTDAQLTKLRSSFTKLFIKYMDKGYTKFKKDLDNANKDKSKGENINFIQQTIPGKSTVVKEAYLQEYFYNDYLGSLNILNMTIGDPAYFKNTIDLQKRFAQVHSSTSKVNKDAEFITEKGNKKYSDGKHRFIILADKNKEFSIKNAVKKAFENKMKNASSTKEKKLYKELMNQILPLYEEKVCTTDGQALSCPTSAWKKMGMLGESNTQVFKEALDCIRKKDYHALHDKIQGISQVVKSFTYTQVPKQTTDEFNPVVPMQLKDSEALMLAQEILKAEDPDNPMLALFEVMEDSHYSKKVHNDETYKDNGIDLAVFKSGVKEGANNIIDISNMSYTEAKDALQKAINRGAIHVSDFSHWGKQQETPIHFLDHSTDLGSQVRILPITDVAEAFSENTGPVKFVGSGGKVYTYNTKQDFIKDYYQLHADIFNLGIQNIQKELGLKNTSIKKQENLKKLVLSSIIKDSKQDKIIYETVLNDFAYGDPAVADKIYSTIFSTIKKQVNKQEFPGGILVQASDILSSKELHIRDSKGRIPTDKNFDLSNGFTVDIMCIPPSTEFAEKITVNKKILKKMPKEKQSKYYDATTKEFKKLYLEVEDIVEYAKDTGITEDELNMILYRIPTEDKYSIYRAKIVGFLPPNSGEQILLPYDTVGLAGFDFDIDKLYCIRKFSESKLSNVHKKKNKIFDMMWGYMGTSSAVEKSLFPGNFQKLKDIADIFDSSSNSRTNIANVTTQVGLRASNSAGKQFVGISALNNISHGISEHSKIRFRGMEKTFRINGVETTFWNENFQADTVFSKFDGSRISRTLGMFVGASADNAKEAVLGRLNITPITANYVMTLFRLGVPLDIVAGIMNLPLIKNMSQNTTSFKFEKAIQNFDVKNSVDPKQVNITFEDLRSIIVDNKSNDIVVDAVRSLLKEVTPYLYGYTRLNNITSLNSTKNAVGPQVFNVIKKKEQINSFLEEYQLFGQPGFDPQMSIFDESILDFFDNVPFLKPLFECYNTLVNDVCKDWSPLFNDTFKTIIQQLKMRGNPIQTFTPELFKKLVNGYFLFNASSIINNFNLKEVMTNTPKTLLLYKDEIINKHKSIENEFLNSLNILEGFGVSNFSIESYASMSGVQDKENISASLDDLLQAGNVKTNNIVKNILIYNFFRYGFSWGPLSISTIASHRAKSVIPEFENIFNNFDSFNIDKFIEQFYCNNTEDINLWEQDVISESELKKIKKQKNLFSVEYSQDKNFPYAFIMNNRYFIKQTDNKNNTEIIYKEVQPLGVSKSFLEYDANKEGTTSIVTRKQSNYKVNSIEDAQNLLEDTDINNEELIQHFSGFISRQKDVILAKTRKQDITDIVKNYLLDIYQDDKQAQNVLNTVIEEVSKLCKK